MSLVQLINAFVCPWITITDPFGVFRGLSCSVFLADLNIKSCMCTSTCTFSDTHTPTHSARALQLCMHLLSCTDHVALPHAGGSRVGGINETVWQMKRTVITMVSEVDNSEELSHFQLCLVALSWSPPTSYTCLLPLFAQPSPRGPRCPP